MRDASHFPCHSQYPIKLEDLRGLKPLINKFLNAGLLRPTSSPYNTSILPIKKTDGTYHLVQDLCIINEAVVPLHPVVPNMYTILRSIPPNTQVFTVFDLKDAFFTIILSRDSQDIFAFTWTDPDTHRFQQLT